MHPENISQNTENTPTGWENMDVKKGPEAADLPLFTKVYGDYKISSLPFDNKSDAYEEINNGWNGAPDVTTYFDQKSKKWYIISK